MVPPTLPVLRLLLGSLVLFVLAGPTPSCADGSSGQIGYVDLDSLGFAPTAEPAVELVIGSAEFSVAALAAQATEPDLASLLASVETFCLHQYAPPDAETVDAATALISALEDGGWQLSQFDLQGTREVSVYVMAQGEMIAGLAVIAIDPGLEVTIANIVGDIDPLKLTTLGLPIPQ